jgi:hypothetical protein
MALVIAIAGATKGRSLRVFVAAGALRSSNPQVTH